MEILELKGINKTYSINGHVLENVLKGIDLKVKKGEFLALLGPSGCGKSTLLNVISGLDTDYEGDIFFKGEPIHAMKDSQLTGFRKKNIGFVFQNFNLISHMTVLENVLIPMYLNGKSYEENKKKAIDLLKSVDLEQHAQKNVKILSGGQKQRVAIARALANDPEIIIADEPTGALDSVAQGKILEILNDLTIQGKTVIVVTHNEELTMFADHIVKLKDGLVVEDIRIDREKQNQESEQQQIKKSSFKLSSSIKLAAANFRQRKWRNIMISLATSIGITGILLSLGLGNGIVKIIEEDMTGGKIPSQIQVSLNSQAGAGIINNNDIEYLSKKIGKEKIRYLEAPFGVRMINAEVEGLGKSDFSETTPSYSQVISLYSDTEIKVTSNKQEDILAGTPYKNPDEEGITITESFIADFNKQKNLEKKATDFIGKSFSATIVESTNEGETKGEFSTKIIRVIKDGNDQENSFMSSRQLGKIISNNKFTKNIPYMIIELKLPEENKKIIDKINQNNKYMAISQAELVNIIVNFIKIIQGLLIFMSSQAVVVSVVMIGIIMYINVIERTREIGVMKAIGYTNRSINTIFVMEASFITFLSLLLAIAFAAGLGGIINIIVASKVETISNVFTLSISSVVYTMLLAIMMSLLSSSVPMMKVGKLDPAASLRYE